MTESFAQLLRAYRDAAALTQEELAERAGITVKAVGALERGERLRPYPHTVRALADALALDEDQRARLVGSVPGRARGDNAVSTAPAQTAPTGELAVAHTALIGRADDLAHIVGLLRDPATRVLTLTGPGGVGKTALATAAAIDAASAFAGGVTLVELAGITDPALVISAIGAALGVPESGHRGTAAGLAAFVSGRRMLILLDNLEQVLDCAPDLAELSAHCPDLAILGTSRAPLRIRPERAVLVEPLPPEASELLFRERADAAGGRVPRSPSEDEAVAEICTRLAGLPLALELAASATALLHPVALLARLDSVLANGPRDLPERQRAMSTTLDWSYDLLGEDERMLLVRLSVLPGTFSLASAEALGDSGVLAALRVLLEHSLVTRAADIRDTERFVLLGPVRQYAAQRLSDDERVALTAAIADSVVREGGNFVGGLRGPELAASLDLAEADLPTLRMVVPHLAATGRGGEAAELLWQLWPFFALRGRGREGLALVDSLRGAALPDRARACLHAAAAGMSFVVGDFPVLHTDGEAALTLARSVGPAELVAEAAVLAGSGALFAGDLDGASQRLSDGGAIAAGGVAPWAELHCRIGEAQVAMVAGSLADAEEALADSERLARALGNGFSLATVLNLRATLAQLLDENHDAARLLAESVDISVGARVSWTFAYALPALASVAVRLGDLERAATLFGAAASWSADTGVDTGFPTSDALARRDLAVAREGLGEELFGASWDAGRDTTGPEIVELAHELTLRARG